MGNFINIPIPKSFKETLTDPIYGEEWREAIVEEITSLEANKTWVKEISPKDSNLISTKWVFTVKMGPDGSLE